MSIYSRSLLSRNGGNTLKIAGAIVISEFAQKNELVDSMWMDWRKNDVMPLLTHTYVFLHQPIDMYVFLRGFYYMGLACKYNGTHLYSPPNPFHEWYQIII